MKNALCILCNSSQILGLSIVICNVVIITGLMGSITE